MGLGGSKPAAIIGDTARERNSVKLGGSTNQKPVKALAPKKAKSRLVAAIRRAERAKPGTPSHAAAQAKLAEQAAQYAFALSEDPGQLPPAGFFTRAESVFAALRPKQKGGAAPVRLLRSSWIKARAKKLQRAKTDEERR